MKILKWLGRTFLNMATVLGVMVMLSIVVSCSAGMMIMNRDTAPALKDPSVLVVVLDDQFDQPISPTSILESPFGQGGLRMTDVLDGLRRAVDDPVIKAIAFRLKGPALSTAQAQELRTAIKAVRAAQKWTVLYTPDFNGAPTVYLAAAFDQVWMQPVGTVAIQGLGGAMPFFKGLLDMVGIGTNFIQRREYKSAMESFTEGGFTPPARANLQALLNDVSDQMITDMAVDRKLDPGAVRAAMDLGLLTGREAKAAGLIDQLGAPDQLTGVIREKLGHDPNNDDAVDFVGVLDYLAFKDPQPKWYEQWDPSFDDQDTRRRVAVIHVEGPIYADHEQDDGMGSGAALTANDVADAIRDAADDDRVVALLVRIDSPGGTPSGSEDLRRALERAREKTKKPIVVTMGSVAASGGYWVATAADHIFALPGTITGSIGVVGGKFDGAELSKKLGVTWDHVGVGANVNMFSPATPFSPSERARMDVMMDDAYAYFTDLVATSRKLSPDVVEGLAKGQVWSGRMAKEKGLVDMLGGLDAAQEYVANQVKIPLTELAFVDYPRPLTPIEEILKLLEGQVMVGAWFNQVRATLMPMRSGVMVYDPMW